MLEKSDLEVLEENLPFWKGATPAEKEILTQGTMRFTHAKGTIVHEDRNKCTGLLLVVSGQLRIYIIGDSGKQITLYRLFERDVCVLSSSCMIRNISFDVHIQAEKETTMLRITTDSYLEAGKSNPQIPKFTNEIVSSRFSDVMWVVEQIVFMSLDRRLAMHLLEQAAIASSDSFAITHEAIAHDLGSAREVITRMLSRFQEDGLVSLSRGGITLLDSSGLYALT